MRYAVPASLWHRPKPSVAWAFGGVKVHRTFTCYRLAHWTFAYIRFTPLAPLRAELRLYSALGLRKGANIKRRSDTVQIYARATRGLNVGRVPIRLSLTKPGYDSKVSCCL